MTASLEVATSLISAPDVTQFAVLGALQPAEASTMLPAIELEDLRSIRQAGWSRVGTITAMADESGRLLMLTHVQSDKTAAGSLGPLAETAQFSDDDGTPRVESAAQTVARSIREELGMSRPERLELVAQPVGAWALSKWPVGIQYEQQYALAICPVVRIGRAGYERLMDEFKPTEEIEAIQFMSPDEIAAAHNLRNGTLGWLGDVAASGLLDVPQSELVVVDLTVPALTGNGQDIRFDRLKV
ncbi:MAG TPA: hypothetical protein VLH86_05365 [Patescibacteria group bacterium]|nr:hypothetical protein [Patescibacteria group bacterium]